MADISTVFLRGDLRLFSRNQAYKHLDLTVAQFITKYRPMQEIPRCLITDNLLAILWDMLDTRMHVCMVFEYVPNNDEEEQQQQSETDSSPGRGRGTDGDYHHNIRIIDRQLKFVGFLNISMVFNLMFAESDLKAMYSLLKMQHAKHKQLQKNAQQQQQQRR